MKKEMRKHPFPWVPVIIVLALIAMMIGIVIKGRGSRGMCAYEHVYRRVTCSAKQLTSIPADVPDSVLMLDMGSEVDKGENYFTMLQPENFTRFTYLQHLELIRCGIEEIQTGTFSGLSHLRVLDLRYNRLQVLHENTFQGIYNLDELYLSNNPIKAIGNNLFRGLRIQYLEFANNPALTDVAGSAFAGAWLKTLVFNRCNLSVLRADALPHLAESLQQLHITNNLSPLFVPDDAMKGLRLSSLVMSNNGLLDAEFIEDIIAEEIILDDNPLEEIDFDDSPKLKHTKQLSVARCKLTRLTKDNLSMLINIQYLDMEGNDIALFNVTAFEDMDDLKVLDLSENDLEGFEGNFSTELPMLRSLSLEENDLQTLPEMLEPLFSRLDNLTLHDNPLHCNCEVRWFAKWIESHRDVLHDLDLVQCETPDEANITHISDYGFQCRQPAIFNATFDPDGVSLVCVADGDPAPTVRWISALGEEAVTQPSKYDRQVTQTRSLLTIVKDGNYTCVAENVAGSDRITINTRKMPTSGIKLKVESREIEILETPQGFCFTLFLIAILGYLFRSS